MANSCGCLSGLTHGGRAGGGPERCSCCCKGLVWGLDRLPGPPASAGPPSCEDTQGFDMEFWTRCTRPAHTHAERGAASRLVGQLVG